MALMMRNGASRSAGLQRRFNSSRPAVPRPIRGNRRTAVVVEANLFSRAVRVFKSYANQIGAYICMQADAADKGYWPVLPAVASVLILHSLCAVSQAEDPEKLLDQVVTEMQEDLIKMRQASAQVQQGCSCLLRHDVVLW